MELFNKLFYVEKKVDDSKQLFNLLPESLKRLLTLSEIRLVISLLKQYYALKQFKGQNIASVISANEYVLTELNKKRRNIPFDAVQAIVSVHDNRNYQF